MSYQENDKPVLLKAVELVLSDPKEIREEALALEKIYHERYKNEKSIEEIKEMVAEKIISNYSYYTAFIGGSTALTGVIPGLGTVISTFGGATVDAAMTMKYQIEMTMALATIYGHDITNTEAQRICLIVAGLGTINEALKGSGKEMTKRAFVKVVKQYLSGSTLIAVKEIFKKVGINFTRKSIEKAIPFGVGVIIGFSANKGLTWYVGTKAKDFFSLTEE